MVAASESLVSDGLPLSRVAGVAYARPMDRAPADSALMLRYQDGDIAAFETLYRRHNDALYRYLLRRCQHRAAAEDLFQEVWSKIIKARADYRPTARFTTFLFRVSQNCFIDYVRSKKRHAQTIDIEPESQPHPGEQPETATERRLARRRLEAALQGLPDEQRDVFLLYEEAGFSLEQIASITGCKRETAKSRLRYAVKKLRDAMNEPAETL